MAHWSLRVSVGGARRLVLWLGGGVLGADGPNWVILRADELHVPFIAVMCRQPLTKHHPR